MTATMATQLFTKPTGGASFLSCRSISTGVIPGRSSSRVFLVTPATTVYLCTTRKLGSPLCMIRMDRALFFRFGNTTIGVQAGRTSLQLRSPTASTQAYCSTINPPNLADLEQCTRLMVEEG